VSSAIAFLRRLGPAGARDNALRACQDYRIALLRVDALSRRLAEQSRPRTGVSGRSAERHARTA
jgi:hypothetical protein